MSAVELITGDLLNQNIEVIVNTWNRGIIPWWRLLPQGVSGAIKKQFGYQPFCEVAKYYIISYRSPVFNNAGRLSFKGVIHLAGVRCGGERQSIRFVNLVVMQYELPKNIRSLLLLSRSPA